MRLDSIKCEKVNPHASTSREIVPGGYCVEKFLRAEIFQRIFANFGQSKFFRGKSGSKEIFACFTFLAFSNIAFSELRVVKVFLTTKVLKNIFNVLCSL